MSYSITYPTKILTLAITGFLFISVGVLCKFAIVPGVYILPSPQKGPRTSFQVTFFIEFFDEKFYFVILHELAKFHY